MDNRTPDHHYDPVTPESRALIAAHRQAILKGTIEPEVLNHPIADLIKSLADPQCLAEARHIDKVRSLEFLARLQKFLMDKPDRIVEHRLVKEYSDEELDKRIKAAQDKIAIEIQPENAEVEGPEADDTIQ